jgi:hypothetical protein
MSKPTYNIQYWIQESGGKRLTSKTYLTIKKLCDEHNLKYDPVRKALRKTGVYIEGDVAVNKN